MTAQMKLSVRLTTCILCADISMFGWLWLAPLTGIDLEDYPNVHKWFEMIAERPAVKAGLEMFPERLAAFQTHEGRQGMIKEARETIAEASA